MNRRERFGETVFPNKEDFYSNLNKQDITDKDHVHFKQIFKEFKIKKIGKYHSLHVQSSTILLADVLQNFTSQWIEIYEIDTTQILLTPGIA